MATVCFIPPAAAFGRHSSFVRSNRIPVPSSPFPYRSLRSRPIPHRHNARHSPTLTASPAPQQQPTPTPSTTTAGAARSALHTAASLATLLGLQHAAARLLAAYSISFPAPLFAMLGLLAVITALRATGLSRFADNAIALVFTPANDFLSRWLAVFFVPNLVMLPLAPLLPPQDFAPILVLLVVGFLVTLLSSATCCVLLRGLVSRITARPPAKVSSDAPPSVPPSNRLIVTLSLAAAVSLIVAVVSPPSLIPLPAYATCAYALVATLLTFCIGQRFPRPLKAVLHPLITCTAGTIGAMALLGLANGAGFELALAGYYVRGAGWGGGNLLASLLGPAVITFALTMDKQRRLALARAPEVIGTTAFATLGSLLGTAAAARALRLSAPSRLLLLPRTITAPLAVAIADILGANVALAASVVALTGLLGANLAAVILSALSVRDPVVRGLAVGASAHGLGTAALNDEGAAFAFSALAMTLVGIFSTLLIAYTPFRTFLIRFALGASAKSAFGSASTALGVPAFPIVPALS